MIPDEIKFNKIWTSKDKFIFRIGDSKKPIGPHWYLKKTLVIWKYFLIDRRKITEETLKEIADVFQKFIDSIPDATIKETAEDYFFSPKDFRQPDTIIDFEKFNDGDQNQEMDTRKVFITYLMGIGGQSCLKKFITEQFSEKNITITKIQKAIPKEQERLKKIKSKCNGLDDSMKLVLSDYHAEIRNYRQLLSYRGIIPQQKDGYTLNEISKLCCNADSTLIMAIWEHQKIIWRVDNPWIRRLRSDNPEQKYKTYEDFQDFKVNNYLGLILVLHELYLKDGKDAYISFEDYKFIISREVPFDIKTVVKKIYDFRNLSQAEKEKIADAFNQRPKTRKFSKNKPKSGSEDFYKEVKNLIYGLSEYKFSSTTSIYNNLLKYNGGKLTINKPKLFEIFAEYLVNVQLYVDGKYGEFYEKVARYVSLKQIDEIYDKSKNEQYKKILEGIRKKYLQNQSDELNAFYDKTLYGWNQYMTGIDDRLLIYAYASVLVLNNYDSIKNEKLFSKFVSNSISDDLVNIIGTEKSDLIKILEETIHNIIGKQPFTEITYSSVSKNSNEDNNWIDKELQTNSMDSLRRKLAKIDSDLRYGHRQGKRERLRNTRMMRLVEKQRLEEKIIMNKKRKNYPVQHCDGCGNKFEKSPERHHMIPFVLHGPDHSLNYAFLCKECHKIFTHDEYSEEAKDKTDELKLRNLVNQENYKEMINNNLLTPDLIGYLHRAGYIHTVQDLELRKTWDQKMNMTEDTFKAKTMPSGERWSRAMDKVYHLRISKHWIMENENDNYEVGNCDGCDTPFKESEPECHHIIPKAQKFRGKAPEGPESPYNYAYLCSICHQKFTSQTPERIEIVKKLKGKGLVTKKTVKKMILHDGLNELQLDYLQVENYIDKTEHKYLLDLMNKMKNYLN